MENETQNQQNSKNTKKLTKKEKRALRLQERAEALQKQQSKKFTVKLIVFIIIIAAITAGAVYAYKQSKKPGKYDALAQCLTDNDVKMYGAYWCPSCAKQKDKFGKSFKLINYVECGIKGNKNAQTEECNKEGIKAYPTWEFNNGERITGVQKISTLAQKAECKLE